MVQTLELRDTRLGKVDQMQTELDSLIRRTDEDKRAWKKKESELLERLGEKDIELNGLKRLRDELEFSKLESIRKDNVI